MNSVFLKTLYDRRWFLLGWCIAFAALTVLMASFFPAMKVTGLADLVANMPPAFKGLVGDLSLMASFDTYITSQLFDIRLPLISGIMAIILGLGLSSAEEETGELRTIPALPISRTKIVIEKWLAIVVITFDMVIAIVAALYATVPFVDGGNIPFDELLPVVGVSWLLMVTFGTIPYAAGVVAGRREVAMATGVVVVIGSFILTTFGQAVDWLKDYERLSLLYYFPANETLKSGVNWADVLVLGCITLVLLIAAVGVFRRRDIG